MAILGSQPEASAQALAASEGLGALLKQSDEVEQSRKLLKKRIDTLAKALKVTVWLRYLHSMYIRHATLHVPSDCMAG